MNKILEIKNLNASINDKLIIKDFNLTVEENEIHVIMGCKLGSCLKWCQPIKARCATLPPLPNKPATSWCRKRRWVKNLFTSSSGVDT